MSNQILEQFELEQNEVITENYNILTANYPYDEDYEVNSIDGYGSKKDYQNHYLEEAEDMYINYLMVDEEGFEYAMMMI